MKTTLACCTRFAGSLLLAGGIALSPVVHAEAVPVSSSLPDSPQPQQQAKVHPEDGQQTKRILGVLPNFRSVSADQVLPPLSPKEKFKLMTQDSFDYSAFAYVGIMAGVGMAQNSYPEFRQGAAGYGRYYWHSFADNVGGNLMSEAVVPTIARQDPRYYTMGHGGLIKRTGYSLSRLVVTRTDSDHRSFNFGEVVGNGAAAGVATLYYPGRERTWTKTGQRWVTSVALDGVSDLIKEFWPDVNHRLFHAH
ncbi:hypothetical protein FTW19_16205 [Terriglobus albidus]|uniref:Lipoprotein n=1 Tax=Terriglobus albidus TaxID=1592106 RepID=A0A5B9ECN2_9BACT|nr:hypothetical protein [Terriglobus albidus]QEE29404.1 hypothetical protein FTW19_16205 [Terriglobus albidus]